jgi:hypothetical protein
MSSNNDDQISELQEALNQVSSFAPIQPTNTNIVIGNYTSERIKPYRVLIISVSFFLCILAFSLLALVLVRLKAAHRRKNPIVVRQKLC